MKRIVVISAIMLLAAGCAKPDHSMDVLNGVCDGLRGKYLTKSITFYGAPVDINGDGECNTDLLKEFRSLSNSMTAIKAFQRIYPARDYDMESTINLEIPIQSVSYDKRTDTYSTAFSGLGMFVTFSYSVGRDGAVTFGVHNDKDSDLWSEGEHDITNLDNKLTHGNRIVSLGNGILVAIVNCVYYDHSTGVLVHGQTEFTYERVSYSL